MGMTIRGTLPSSPGGPTRQFFDKFLRVPEGGRLVPMQLHAEQERALDAWDALDPLTGLPIYDAHLWAWIKKSGKSTGAGGVQLKELVAGIGEDREIIDVASDFEQSKSVTFASSVRFVRRHLWLTKRIQIKNSELVFKETVTDPNTGGRHVQEHIIRAVPARDARSLHGVNPVLVVVDETWAQNDYAVLEALSASPTRKVSRTLVHELRGAEIGDARGRAVVGSLAAMESGHGPQAVCQLHRWAGWLETDPVDQAQLHREPEAEVRLGAQQVQTVVAQRMGSRRRGLIPQR
jgi:hypothetical protein